MTRIRYYPDSRPGILRQRRGRGFSYVAPDGTRIGCTDKRREIEAIAVPPAYEDVWISPVRNGHLRASGRDAKERKQYIYHPVWVALQDAEKFDRLISLGRSLPRLRGWITRNLAGPVGRFETAVAAGLALTDRLSMRVGDPAYTEENGSYGVTTLERRHLRRAGQGYVLNFIAKGGRSVELPVAGARLGHTLAELAKLPGPALLSWVDGEGAAHALRAAHLNARMAELCGEGQTAKALRTWNGTHAAFLSARCEERPTITRMADAASRRLHNTPAVARNSYIHPAVLEAGRGGGAPDARQGCPRKGLRRGEAALLEFLERETQVA